LQVGRFVTITSCFKRRCRRHQNWFV